MSSFFLFLQVLAHFFIFFKIGRSFNEKVNMRPNAHMAISIVFLQALLAMAGSLYFSNYGDPISNFMAGDFFPTDGGFPPCHLCWWARILMYPIVVIGLVGIWVRDYSGALRYALTLSIPGIVLEAYHYALQKFDISTAEFCTLDNPCVAMSVDYFGFITIPFLCLVAFFVIFLVSLWGLKKS